MELGGPMLRIVRKILGAHHPDAEDVAQEAILGLVRGLHRFRGDCSVTQYAHQVALRSALHARRHFQVRDRLGSSELEAPEPVDVTDRSPLETAVSRERRRIVRSLLGCLPEPTTEALALHFMLGHTVEEIAGMLGVSPNTIWSRLKLGKKALRRALENDKRLNDLLRGDRS
jgi:RNA polymerase sigma-70 factor (ECF subfamily)